MEIPLNGSLVLRSEQLQIHQVETEIILFFSTFIFNTFYRSHYQSYTNVKLTACHRTSYVKSLPS